MINKGGDGFKSKIAQPMSSMPYPFSQEQDASDDWLMEQYKLAFSSFDNELQRFWVRFNVLVGVQIFTAAGLLSKMTTIQQTPWLLLPLSLFMLIFSSLTVFVLYRGTIIYSVFVNQLAIIEKISINRLFLIHVADELTVWPIRNPYGMWVAALVAALLLPLWLLFAAYSLTLHDWSFLRVLYDVVYQIVFSLYLIAETVSSNF